MALHKAAQWCKAEPVEQQGDAGSPCSEPFFAGKQEHEHPEETVQHVAAAVAAVVLAAEDEGLDEDPESAAGRDGDLEDVADEDPDGDR